MSRDDDAVAGEESGGDVLHVVLRSQAQTIENQQQTIQQQQLTIEILSGARGKAAALEMPIATAWENYCRTLPEVRWKVVVICMMKRFIARFGHIRVGDFGPLHWEEFRDDPAMREFYGSTSRNLILRRAKIMFNWMVNTDQIGANPLRRAKPEKKKPRRKTELHEDDEDVVLGEINNPVMNAIVIVALDSGMRRTEVRTLEWADVDFDARTVFLPAARTKTGKDRTVKLTTRAIEAVQALPRHEECPYVFANPRRKKPYSENFIWTRWRKVIDENQIKAAPGDGRMHFHDLRHTTGSRLIRFGATLPAVQEILGHDNLETTALYVHARPKDVLDAHELLEKATRKGPHRAPAPDTSDDRERSTG